MKFDYLIIGQGLAGSALAYQLLQKKKQLAIIDHPQKSASSRVAAGLVNPITGPKMVKTWKAEKLFATLKSFYPAIEQTTYSSFFSRRIIYRPFVSAAAINDWDARSSLPGYAQYIRQMCPKDTHAKYVSDEYGGIEVKGYLLNVPIYLQAMRKHLATHALVKDEVFLEEKLVITEDSIQYGDIEACKVIYCNGYQAMHSTYFHWLPWAPVKGEILHVRIEEEFETIYNKSGFIIPQGQGLYKAGSTYDRNDMTEQTTTKARSEIINKLQAFFKLPLDIEGQEAGIRPGTSSRRPLIGWHPIHGNIGIFNGLGTKGVSLAPYFSQQFVNYMEEGHNLDTEVDIKRYNSLYFKSQSIKEN